MQIVASHIQFNLSLVLLNVKVVFLKISPYCDFPQKRENVESYVLAHCQISLVILSSNNKKPFCVNKGECCRVMHMQSRICAEHIRVAKVI